MTVVCLVILAGIFWGDFFLKNYIESHENERDERVICKGKFLIRKHHNKGMMLNAGQKRRRLVAAVSLAFTLILTVVFIVSLGHRGNNLLRLGLALLLGGAFSNTYDRLRRGYVVDYVSFPVKWQAFRKKNPDFWVKKIERNRNRDYENDKKLLFLGYTVLHFWGQDISKHTDECLQAIEEAIWDARFSDITTDYDISE